MRLRLAEGGALAMRLSLFVVVVAEAGNFITIAGWKCRLYSWIKQRSAERQARGNIMEDPEYELFALRYATRDARRGDHFIGGDPHDGPMPMDYFVWVAKGGGRTFVIDTGFNAEVSARRKRTFLRDPVEALAALGIDANAVEDVI